MVKSGLRDEIISNKEVARVSQYRLASHLTLALLLYVGMLGLGLRKRADWRWAKGGAWSGVNVTGGTLGKEPWREVMGVKSVKKFRGRCAWFGFPRLPHCFLRCVLLLFPLRKLTF